MDDGRFVVMGQCYVDWILHVEAVAWAEEEADTFLIR